MFLKQISGQLLEKITAIKPETLQMSQSIMAVVIEATEDQWKQTCDNCEDVMVLNLCSFMCICSYLKYHHIKCLRSNISAFFFLYCFSRLGKKN